jgi:hypothetical protein
LYLGEKRDSSLFEKCDELRKQNAELPGGRSIGQKGGMSTSGIYKNR